MNTPRIMFNKAMIPSNQSCLHYNDRSFMLGHGLFETILVKHGVAPALDYHWKRLEKSAGIVGITLPFSYEELARMIDELISDNALKHTLASARLTVSSGDSLRGLVPSGALTPNVILSVFEHAPNSGPWSAKIVSIKKNEHAPSSRLKSTSYIDNIFAKQEALNLGYDEAVLLNTQANVADGAVSNIFMIKDSRVITPPVSDGALPGIIRSILLEELAGLFSITEKTIPLAELMMADEIFLTNALMGVQSLCRLNKKVFNRFCLTREIADTLRDKKNYI